MPGLGTIINVSLIIVGGIIGALFGKILSERFRDTIMSACAVAVLFVGIGGALQKMLVVENGTLQTSGSMMMILSLAIGAVIGELIDLDRRMTQFGNWLKIKTGSTGDKGFTDAFVSASLTVCIGAMAVVGAIQDGIAADHSVLVAKGILDFVIILVMTSSMGKGAIFSFIPVGLFQGTITILARAASPFITDPAMNNLSYVGSILIFCVGVNLLWPGKIKVANILPSIFVAMAFAFIPGI